VNVQLTIGEFSKMSYLTVKALRHYHDIGLLEPTAVDPANGYRSYSSEQVATAQAIRRFRDLDMPIDQVRAVLEAPDTEARNQAILQHLEHMQRQLEKTQLTVASLQSLLASGPSSPPVEYRWLPPTSALAISDIVGFDAAGEWCETVFAELHDATERAGGAPDGPDGALYFDEIFETGEGRVTAFVPIDGEVTPRGRATVVELPVAHVAVLVHEGAFNDLDQTYGALGTVVSERGMAEAGPIREHYLPQGRTEVCWPIGAQASAW
jgi:DNA-binding transcriptional MerR regulator